MDSKATKPIYSPWLYDTEPFNMAENIYYVGNKSVSSHLFDTGDGLLLLDTTYMQTAYLLLESIRKLGFNPNDIRWILHSHGHYDHFGGTRILVEKYGCKTYFPERDICFLKEKNVLNYAHDAGLDYEIPYGMYFDVDVPVHDGEEFEFGNIKMKAVSAPGHTPGTMAYFFTLPDGLVATMHGGMGRNTLASSYLKSHNLDKSWRVDFVNTLTKLRNYHVDIVLGNHPNQNETFERQTQKGFLPSNPFIDDTYWNRMLDRTLEKYRAMEAADPM